MSVQNITSLEEFNALLAKPGLVVVDFTAVWCGPCMFIAPKYAELAAAETSVTFAKVDVDQADDVADDQQINSFPTFKFFKDYQLLEEFSGADLPKIIELVAKYK